MAAGCVVVVLLGVVWVFRAGSTRSPSSQAAGAVPVVTAGAAISDAQDTQVPSSAPAVTWALYRTLALPFSPVAGPANVSGDVATGYAHTPTGALIAADQIGARYRMANDWRGVLEASVASGPGRQVWMATRSKYGDWDPPQPGTLCQDTGFVFVDYTPARAVIQLASRCPAGGLQTVSATVAWDGGDWKLVLAPDGGLGPVAQVITSLDGYVVWGGV